MKRLFFAVAIIISIASALFQTGCSSKSQDFKVYAWLAGEVDMPDQDLDYYFRKSAEVGIDGILLECHGGYPEILGDSTSFRDSAALVILRRAAVYAKKYNVELHAWMWTTNRCEKALRNAHPEWYQINGNGESLNDIKLYNREHYRFLCPNHEGVTEYLKERVRELAEVDGLTGIHLDFIRYPDAILPYGLHKSRGVVQDKVYPLWDCCYCDECRAQFKAKYGVDPLDLEDPTSNADWMQFRWDTMAKFASDIAAEIKACGKVASCAVFASPAESKKLVRQDWANYRNMDMIIPMIYHDMYNQPGQWLETATQEGVEALAAAKNKAKVISGFIPSRQTTLEQYLQYAKNGGAAGMAIFSLESFKRRPENWELLDRTLNYENRADWVAAQMHKTNTPHVIIAAHRGDWRNYPENSLPSIESVIRMGADIMELDLKMTKDSVLVLSHDITVDRCTDGTGKVSDYLYADLVKLHLRNNEGEVVDTLHIPTLKEALQVCKDKICVNVDQGYWYYDQVLKITEELGVTDQILIKNVMPYEQAKATMDKYPHNMMYMPIINLWTTDGVEMLDEYLQEGKTPIAFEVCFRNWEDSVFVNSSRAIRAAGAKVWTNTLWPSISGGPGTDDQTAWGGERPNPDAVYGRLLDNGVTMIQTNNVKEVLEYLRRIGRHD